MHRIAHRYTADLLLQMSIRLRVAAFSNHCQPLPLLPVFLRHRSFPLSTYRLELSVLIYLLPTRSDFRNRPLMISSPASLDAFRPWYARHLCGGAETSGVQ